MSGTGHRTVKDLGKDFWIAVVAIAGALLLVGIFSVAGSFVNNIGATDINTANSGGSELNQPFTGDDDTEDVSEEIEAVGYTGKYYPVDDIPSVLVLPQFMLDKPQYKQWGNLQVTNLRYEDGKFKFCLQDNVLRYSALTIHICIKNAGGTPLDRFEKVEVPMGEKVCLETRKMDHLIKGGPDEIRIEIT